MSEQAKTLVRTYLDAANSHEPEKWRDILASNYVHHDPNLPVPDADLDTHIMLIGGMINALARWRFTGTHDAELKGDPGIPATGNSVEVHCMSTHRIEGDRIAETWVVFDIMGMMMQLGVIPPQS
jgi:hypothetical protein